MPEPVLIAYIDESGNTGNPALSGSTQSFTLGCVLVDGDEWPDSFDQLVAFRKRLKLTYGIPTRAELKANYLIRSSGDIRKLGLAPGQRSRVYRAHLDMLAQMRARAFAVVFDKDTLWQSEDQCFEEAWLTLAQRLERTSFYENQTIMVVHDNGQDDAIRKLFRKARRYMTAPMIGGQGSWQVNVRRMIEDPIPRDSRHSYWIQMADLVAYAGWRAIVPPSASVAAVVPGDMWGAVGLATHTAVNRLSGGVPGVVHRHK